LPIAASGPESIPSRLVKIDTISMTPMISATETATD